MKWTASYHKQEAFCFSIINNNPRINVHITVVRQLLCTSSYFHTGVRVIINGESIELKDICISFLDGKKTNAYSMMSFDCMRCANKLFSLCLNINTQNLQCYWLAFCFKTVCIKQPPSVIMLPHHHALYVVA